MKKNGDAAVFGYTKQFDGVEITAENIRVTEAEIEEAYANVDQRLLEVIRKYVNISTEDVQVALENQGSCSILELNVTLPER